MNEDTQTYYYNDADGKITGPVSEQELRQLLDQGIIQMSTDILQKGEKQWINLSDVLNLPKQSEPTNDFPPPSKEYNDNKKSLNIEKLEKNINNINSLVDNYLYKIFNFDKLLPYFKKWIDLSVTLTNVLTILTCIIITFAWLSVQYMDSSIPFGVMITSIIGSTLIGVLVQYVSGLFSKANINYFYSNKPVLSSMALPKSNAIILILALIGHIFVLYNAYEIIMALLVIASMLMLVYMIWLNLNSNKIFIEVKEKEASATSDLVGYIRYQLRFLLIISQTLLPICFLALSSLGLYIIFSNTESIFAKIIVGILANISIPAGVTLLCAPILIHFVYVVLSVIPELISSIMRNKEKSQ